MHVQQSAGHTFSIGGKQYNTQGAMLAFLGDAPAANKAGGFKEGVSLAARKCRHCMATDIQIQTKVSLTMTLPFKIVTFILCYICGSLKKNL